MHKPFDFLTAIGDFVNRKAFPFVKTPFFSPLKHNHSHVEFKPKVAFAYSSKCRKQNRKQSDSSCVSLSDGWPIVIHKAILGGADCCSVENSGETGCFSWMTVVKTLTYKQSIVQCLCNLPPLVKPVHLYWHCVGAVLIKLGPIWDFYAFLMFVRCRMWNTGGVTEMCTLQDQNLCKCGGGDCTELSLMHGLGAAWLAT